MSEYYFKDFTEENYKVLLELAKKNYCFVNYAQYKQDGKIIIWRHDIDFSVHRAYSLACIESKFGIASTFFVDPHSKYYNFWEKEISNLIIEILGMGHHLGLHFDLSYYDFREVILEEYLNFEKNTLERIFKKSIDVVSFHNPDTSTSSLLHNEKICGMINTYSEYFMDNYGYCSDSNGYWRYGRLENVLQEAKYQKLQVLTHPEWWTPVPMSPRERISRCIEGRAKRNHLFYDELLDKFSRKNIK